LIFIPSPDPPATGLNVVIVAVQAVINQAASPAIPIILGAICLGPLNPFWQCPIHPGSLADRYFSRSLKGFVKFLLVGFHFPSPFALVGLGLSGILVVVFLASEFLSHVRHALFAIHQFTPRNVH
jgi:hypothetical protein